MLLLKYGEKGKAADAVFSFPWPCAAKIYSSLIILIAGQGHCPGWRENLEEMWLLYCDWGFPRFLLRPSLRSYCSLMIELSREQLLRVEFELQAASQLGLEEPIGVVQMSCSLFLAGKDPL